MKIEKLAPPPPKNKLKRRPWGGGGGRYISSTEGIFLGGGLAPPHKISAYTPLGRERWTTGQFLPSVLQFLTVQPAIIGGATPDDTQYHK